MNQSKPYQVVVVAPVYDDAAAALQLVQNIERAFAVSEIELRVVFVDDGSRTPVLQELEAGCRRLRGNGGSEIAVDVSQTLTGNATVAVHVLRLRRNVGHQRAIALGTAFVHDHISCDAMLVMDADGEDRPEDAVTLVAHCRAQEEQRIIFAERARRSESPLFQMGYRCYQVLHWLLTGIRVRVGNFSVVPARYLDALVTLPALWNHYAAAIFQARLPRALVPTMRGQRYSGQSKMHFVALVIHGLQAISVFIEVVAVRLLLAVGIIAGCCALLFGMTLVQRVWAGGTAFRWMPFTFGALLVTALSLGLGSLSLTLGLLAQRNNLNFIPLRDYRLFIEGVYEVGADANLDATQEEKPRRAANE